MDLVQRIAEALKQFGATDVQVTPNDTNTEYERQQRITCVYEGRAYELDMGLVRQHGGSSK
jgi:hypothetical protein